MVVPRPVLVAYDRAASNGRTEAGNFKIQLARPRESIIKECIVQG